MEKSMTQETAWFRTYSMSSELILPPPPPPPADSLVNSELSLTSDGEKFEQWGLSPDHLVGAEFI